MKELYFTITGTNHYYGNSFLEPKTKVRYVLPKGVICSVKIEG